MKQEEKEERRKKDKMENGHILQSVKNHENCAVHLSN